MFKLTFIFFLIFNFLKLSFIYAQNEDTIKKISKYNFLEIKIIDGDSFPHIYLDDFFVFSPLKFKNNIQKRKYFRLLRKLKKVLPYAKKAGKILVNINDTISKLKTEKEKKKYIKKADKHLQEEFAGKLKKLTFSEGRLLIKLIHRETGKTVYDLVKNLRGSWTAWFWQTVAKLFGSNLKKKYRPKSKDKLIENIIVRIENNQI